MAAHGGDVIVFIVSNGTGGEQCAVSFEALCDLGGVAPKTAPAVIAKGLPISDPKHH